MNFNIKTQLLPQIDESQAEQNAAQIIDASRTKYTRPRAEVEEELSKMYGRVDIEPSKEEKPQITTREKPVVGKPVPQSKKETTTKLESIELVQAGKPTDPLPGRGSPQHQYLQQLISRLAHERGFKANVEHPVLDNNWYVDVVLEREKKRIACEISITTPAEHEVANIQKCLAAGFNNIVMMSHEEKRLEILKKQITEALNKSDSKKVVYVTPEGFIEYLDNIDQKLPKPKRQKRHGYEVNVNYATTTHEEQKMKKQTIARIIVESMKEMKKP